MTAPDGSSEHARIDSYEDQGQFDAAKQFVTDSGFGTESVVVCDLWSVGLDTAETANALASALGCTTGM
ncbi:MAG TPA: hypothetical protein VJM33_15660 [Microthrixaceae bacterium]|nr:hypothetical protein [Microthrixaceae bacterium]